jgi:hypothetical protein
MPTLWAHSLFWAGASGSPPADPPLGDGRSGGYVPWQTTIIATMSLALAVRWSANP